MVLHKISFSLLLLTVITTSVVSFGLSYLGNYEEGQNCGTNSEENGYFGKCLKIKDCKSEFNEYKNNQRGLQVCSYSANKNSEEDLICCSKDDLEKSILDEPWMKVGRSLEYNECVFRYLDYREIYGCNSIGSTSSATEHSAVYQGEFPNMVAVGWTQDDKTVEYNCGGSIITEFFIVTAAHCSSDSGIKPDVVRIGDIDLISDTDDEDVQQLNIESIIRHPEYSFQSYIHDIALIKVDREIIMNEYVAPACIMERFEYKYSEEAGEYLKVSVQNEVAGYGQTGHFEEKANKLLKVSFQDVEKKECNNYLDNFDDQNMRLGIRQQFCAKVSVIDGIKKDTCFGDVGSGIQNKRNFTYGKTVYIIPTLDGLVSYGGCGQGYFTVFTQIGSYIDWMESVIFPV